MNSNNMDINIILPYIVSIVSSLIAGFSSYSVARKQAKEDIKQIEKRHELDIEKERERFQLEKEKMEINYKHQLELLNKEAENKMSAGIMDKFMAEIMKNPSIQHQISQSLNNRKKG